MAVARADIITLKSGRTMKGTVLQTNEDNVLILADYGTANLPPNLIDNIKPEPNKQPKTLSTNTVTLDSRVFEWKTVVSKLATQWWSSNLKQIPATVITNGILRNV